MPFFSWSLCILRGFVSEGVSGASCFVRFERFCSTSLFGRLVGESPRCKNPRAFCSGAGAWMTQVRYLRKRPTPRSKYENDEVNKANYLRLV